MGASESKSTKGRGKDTREKNGATSNKPSFSSSPSPPPFHDNTVAALTPPRLPGKVSIVGIPETHSSIEQLLVYPSSRRIIAEVLEEVLFHCSPQQKQEQQSANASISSSKTHRALIEELFLVFGGVFPIGYVPAVMEEEGKESVTKKTSTSTTTTSASTTQTADKDGTPQSSPPPAASPTTAASATTTPTAAKKSILLANTSNNLPTPATLPIDKLAVLVALLASSHVTIQSLLKAKARARTAPTTTTTNTTAAADANNATNNTNTNAAIDGCVHADADAVDAVITDPSARIVLNFIGALVEKERERRERRLLGRGGRSDGGGAGGSANANADDSDEDLTAAALFRQEALLMRTVNTPQSLLDTIASHLHFSDTTISEGGGKTTQLPPSQASSAKTAKSGGGVGVGTSSDKQQQQDDSSAATQQQQHHPIDIPPNIHAPIGGGPEWYLLFSTRYHGKSFNQMASAICGRGPTVTVIEVAPEDRVNKDDDDERKNPHSVSVTEGELEKPYWKEVAGKDSVTDSFSGGEGGGGGGNDDYYSNYYGGGGGSGAGNASGETKKKTTVPSNVFIGGFNMCNWLNASQREKLAKSAAAAAAAAAASGSGSSGVSNNGNVNGGGAFSASNQPYATGALSFLNNNLNGSNTTDATNNGTASVDPAAVAGIFSPSTNPSFNPTPPSALSAQGLSQHALFNGNNNCWLFRADGYHCCSSPPPTSLKEEEEEKEKALVAARSRCSSSASSPPPTIDPNFGYFNGRGDYTQNMTNFKLFRPTNTPAAAAVNTTTRGGTSSSAAASARNNANYQYLLEQHPVDASKVGFGMGGDVGSWAWFVDKWLEHGSCNTTMASSSSDGFNSPTSTTAYASRKATSSHKDEDDDPTRLRRCPTFNTLLLAPWQRWKVMAVEVFAVEPTAVAHFKRIDALNAEAARRADDGKGNKLKLSDPLPPLEVIPMATTAAGASAILGITSMGEYISLAIGAAFGDVNLALARDLEFMASNAVVGNRGGGSGNANQNAKNKGGGGGKRNAAGGVLAGEGASCDKMILEMNNNNVFRDDVVEDGDYDYSQGCGMGTGRTA